MTPRYLLPCSCGREIPIEAGQAGQVVRCQCGAELETPTLLRMSALKRVTDLAPATAPRKSRWGIRQQLALLGMIIAVPCLLLALLAFLSRPPQRAVLAYMPMESLTYVQAWQTWQDLRGGIQRRANEAETWYANASKFNRRWTGVFLAIGAVGILLMASSMFVRKMT
jgi:hypothetical protein